MSSSQRCYTVAELLALLKVARATFFEKKRRGEMPYLEELRPRLGRRARFRADLVDRYLDGQWGRARSFASHRKIAS